MKATEKIGYTFILVYKTLILSKTIYRHFYDVTTTLNDDVTKCSI